MDILLKKIRTVSRAIYEVIKAAFKDKPQCFAHIQIEDAKTGKAQLAIYVLNLSQGDALALTNSITGQALANIRGAEAKSQEAHNLPTD